MSWDWKKAIGVGDAPQGTVLDGGAGQRHSPGGKRRPVQPPGAERSPSIVWRPAGLGGVGPLGGSVELQVESEYECPFCRGRGELGSASVCPVCNGSGKVHVEPPAVRCAFCSGQGQMPPRSNLTCWVCKGKGLVPVTPPVQTCPDCQGRGKRPCESLYCPRCRGLGVVPWTDGL